MDLMLILTNLSRSYSPLFQPAGVGGCGVVANGRFSASNHVTAEMHQESSQVLEYRSLFVSLCLSPSLTWECGVVAYGIFPAFNHVTAEMLQELSQVFIYISVSISVYLYVFLSVKWECGMVTWSRFSVLNHVTAEMHQESPQVFIYLYICKSFFASLFSNVSLIWESGMVAVGILSGSIHVSIKLHQDTLQISNYTSVSLSIISIPISLLFGNVAWWLMVYSLSQIMSPQKCTRSPHRYKTIDLYLYLYVSLPPIFGNVAWWLMVYSLPPIMSLLKFVRSPCLSWYLSSISDMGVLHGGIWYIIYRVITEKYQKSSQVYNFISVSLSTCLCVYLSLQFWSVAWW